MNLLYKKIFLILLAYPDWISSLSPYMDCHDCTFNPTVTTLHQEDCKTNPSSDRTCQSTNVGGCGMTFSTDGNLVVRACLRKSSDINNGQTGCTDIPDGEEGHPGRQCYCNWENCNNLVMEKAENIESYRPTTPLPSKITTTKEETTEKEVTTTIMIPTTVTVASKAQGLMSLRILGTFCVALSILSMSF